MKKINKQNFISLLVITLIIGGFYVYQKSNSHAYISIIGHDYKVEIVKTLEDRSKGLGNRNDLCSECGMLFIFDKKGEYNFWMKDMRFPLDIIWISEGKIVHIEKEVSNSDQRILKPNVEADKVLEINAGQSQEFGFEAGDDVLVTDKK